MPPRRAGGQPLSSHLSPSPRAQLRVLVKRILRKYGYPPDKQEQATKTVLEQAELLSADCAACTRLRRRGVSQNSPQHRPIPRVLRAQSARPPNGAYETRT